MLHAFPANEHLLISYCGISVIPSLKYAISDSKETETLNMATIAKLLKAGKVLLVVSLISIFLNYFGLKSWERYKNQKVLVIKSWEKPDFLPTPSITVCSSSSGTGFKNVTKETMRSATAEEKSIFEYICGGLEGEGLVECVENNVFDLGSIVQFEGYGPSIRIDRNTVKNFPINEEHWKMKFDSAESPCRTFQNNQHIGTIEKGLRIGLNQNMKHAVFVHDPRYFIRSKNPDIPVNECVLEPGTYDIMSMIVVEHRNLDVPSKRCNSEEKYSLTDCVREAFSKDVGCNLHWAKYDLREDLPTCTTIDQYRLASCASCSKFLQLSKNS